MSDKQIIYMDHAATTATRPEVVASMLPYFSMQYGNPSSQYIIAQKNRSAIEECRRKIVNSLNAKTGNIYFTAGGTEADNWALKGIACLYERGHIITSKIEHHAIIHTCDYLKKHGYDITYLDADENGIIRPEKVKSAIRKDTILISIMYANNEIGTIQPIKEIGEIARRYNILFHTDAVQAYGQIPIDVDECNIAMLSASGHKLRGPKGIGFLYIRKGVNIESFIHGGAQEEGLRAGTENVPAIIGLSKAVDVSFNTMQERIKQEVKLRDYMIERIINEIPYVRLNGHRIRRLPNNVNVSFQFVQGESLLVMLDMDGICASAGSACTSGLASPSHVLLAIGLPYDIAYGTIRFTLGYENTLSQIDYVVDRIKMHVAKLREKSPQYEDFIKGNT
ncbi:MAG: cysteine desulfurase NifS [Lachnospiraceae bacterium]|nr:cysteine desulfurase NifS [Lachnospiraceae bacterium]